MGKSRRNNLNLVVQQYSGDFLDRVDEVLQDYVNNDDMSFMDDDEITDYIDEQMISSTHSFTRVDNMKHFPDIEEGDTIEFNSYYASFSESMDASKQYASEMSDSDQIIIFRTNGKVKTFDMSDYEDSYYSWQQEHLIHGWPDNGWNVDKVTDVSSDPQFSNIIQTSEGKILLVDISVNE